MLLTEEEANKRYCTHIRLTSDEEDYFCCIASDCMAWRWDENMTMGELKKTPKEQLKGFCGLAGKSEIVI